jgi:hypothetical protein
MPTGLMTNNPNMQKPRWLTDEYAISRFMSVCAKATIAPYRIPITASDNTNGMQATVASGKSGRLKRTNP